MRKVEAAPCFVPLPTSSLSSTQWTGIEVLPLSLSVFRKAVREAKTHCRSSSLGAEMYSPAAPQQIPGMRQ